LRRQTIVLLSILSVAVAAMVIGLSAPRRSEAASTLQPSATPTANGGGDDTAQAATDYRRRHFPAAQKLVNRAPLPKGEVVARAWAAAATPFTTAAPRSAPAKARLMRLGDFDRANGLVTDPLLSPTQLVWVVTVHAPTALLARPGDRPRRATVYTTVYDAVTGDPIENGVGIDFVR
jgi:hypothetical protein